jgi:CheY-like chemotaxis protein
LPKVSGLEVLEEIKSTVALREIPVIVLTTSAAKADIEWAYSWQADGYIVKPSSFNGFMDLVQELKQTWLPN